MIPEPALIVLVGPAGSGKSTWAAQHYRRGAIVSSDALRDVVGTGPADLDASTDAFVVLDVVVAARLNRRLTCVIDTLGLDPDRRRGYLAAARAAGVPAVAVLFRTPLPLCRSRNAARDRPVPAPVLAGQHRKLRALDEEIDGDGWDLVVRVDTEEDTRPAAAAIEPERNDRGQLDVVLQVSAFPWGSDPIGWLTSVATAAEEVGFSGLALMDHLIQIPQVGRAWDPIPEPLVTLGLLAGRTSTLQLGTLVSPVSFRSPGLVAKSVATLDVLSGGRAWCGLGLGWWDREHAAFGLDLPSVRERADRLAAGIETIRALWGSGTKSYRSERIQLPETTCYPRPVHDIPIVVGGSGRQTLAVAAELADAVNLPSVASLDAKIPVLREHCQRLARDPASLEISVLDLPVVGENVDHVSTLVEKLRGRTSAAAYAKSHGAGLAADHIARYRDLARRGVRTIYASLPDLSGPAEVHRFAPIVAAFR